MSVLRGTAWRWLSARPALSIVVALMLPLVALRIVLLLGRRVPMGHDSLQYLQLEYTFWNEAAITGMPPQWMPFMTHGTLSNVWVVISQGMLVGALTPFARFLDGVNFLYIYHAGLLFDEFALLLGCVLLGRRYFRSWAAVIFAAAAVTYTAASSTQPWYGFHLFYLLPLLLYCGDRAVRDASARYLFLFGLLGVATMLGNLPYFAPITAFTVLVFAAAAAAISPREVTPTLKRLLRGLSWRHALALLIPVALLGIFQMYLGSSQHSIIYFNVGRTQDGNVVALADFLTYGGYISFSKYLELFGRYSNNIDNTIYSGVLMVPFALLAALRMRSRTSYTFALSSLVMVLFAGGTMVSAAFFYLFPMGDFYRHIGLAAPIAMMFLTLYAGFGVDVFWAETRASREKPIRERLHVWVPLLALCGALLFILGERLQWWSVLDITPWAGVPTANQPVIERSQFNTALMKVLGLLGIYVVAFLATARWPRQAAVLGVVVMAAHVGDVFTRKYELEYERIPAASQEIVSLLDVRRYEFVPQRSQDYASNPRYVALAPVLFPPGEEPTFDQPYLRAIGEHGALYWNTESFIFFDAGASIFRSDHWLKDVDAFYNAVRPPSVLITYGHRGFPIPQSNAYKHLTGFEFPKLQLFSRMHLLDDDVQVTSVLAEPEFAGDLILGSRQALAPSLDLLPAEARSLMVAAASVGDVGPAENDRLSSGTIEVEDFVFDSLRLSVMNPGNDWALLYYADGWHENWQATVNGEATPVLRANLAYKAVPVPPGRSEVVLSFGAVGADALLWGVVLASVLAVAAVLGLGASLFRAEPPLDGPANAHE